MIQKHRHQPRALAVEETEFIGNAGEDFLERDGLPGRVEELQDLFFDLIQHRRRRTEK